MIIHLDQEQRKIRIKKYIYESAYALYEGRELTLCAFKNGIFLIKATQKEELKILTPKQILQRLPVAPAKAQANNTSENLINEIPQIISLYLL